jgi:hypothetical protein
MFVTIEGTHLNMNYFSGFSWVNGEVRISNTAGRLSRLPDPDRSIYLKMCEKAGVMPEPTKEGAE